MISRAQELCRQLKPVLGRKIDRLWSVYLSESDPSGRREIEQTLELLAAKHLKKSFEQDHNPFPPPSSKFAGAGEIELGSVHYGSSDLYPFRLKSRRLTEHVLISGRSGSGKTNLTFILAEEIINKGIKLLALDWKRGYRDLCSRNSDILVFTVGRGVSPIRFNPLIPPPGCEPNLWIKMVVEVIANAYLGGEGVISLLVAGLDQLYRQAGVYDRQSAHWPTVQDLLGWLRGTKLKGRAAMWQASAERILLAMMYGEFGAVMNTRDNSHVADLLNHNVVLEMDGLSSSSDKTLFSEALTLYLYRYRLAKGPLKKLTNMIILEEAHNLLLKKTSESRESVLETSIRMIRQYGMGYVFVDQSASLLSRVAFANSYCTLALSQKLRSDIQTLAGAMNLSDEQKQALSTLEIGTAVVRLADEFPQAFQVKIPLSRVREGSVSDDMVRERMKGFYSDTATNKASKGNLKVITPVPPPDKNNEIIPQEKIKRDSHPPAPVKADTQTRLNSAIASRPPVTMLTREELGFLADIITAPLLTTVSRYQRLHISRRKGNAVRRSLLESDFIQAVTIPTRSGQSVLYELTDAGREACKKHGIDPGPLPREGLEHRFWVQRTRQYFQDKGYSVTLEHPVKGNGAIDLLAARPGERIAVEVETGKSDIKANLAHLKLSEVDKTVLIATCPEAIGACKAAIETAGQDRVELLNWLDVD
jgi:hypothetical protein